MPIKRKADPVNFGKSAANLLGGIFSLEEHVSTIVWLQSKVSGESFQETGKSENVQFSDGQLSTIC